MASLRIGIDVGGTFTHGVVLRPPGQVLHTAVTPTTHTHQHGVAGGVKTVLLELVAKVDSAEIELVAHSTTQATNALLEGDVASVLRVVIVPPGEGLLCRNSLKGDSLDIGNGHSIALTNHFINQADVAAENWQSLNIPVDNNNPVAIIQPLAGDVENLEHKVAKYLAQPGRPVVCASDITKVLGLQARARTAVVNASMLPTMLATAEYTRQAVDEVLPGVPVQVVRSDGGAMSLDEMRRMPVLSLLSGPAAGASAALHRTGLSEVIFIEVGGTSTDITLISGGRVRHRYATVGGQRLMVPALDLRTVAVGGGSMLRTHSFLFGPRSAHIAGLPYLFQELATGKSISYQRAWNQRGDLVEVEHSPETVLDNFIPNTELTRPLKERLSRGVFFTEILTPVESNYLVQEMEDGTTAAMTLTDMWLADAVAHGKLLLTGFGECNMTEIRSTLTGCFADNYSKHRSKTIMLVVKSIQELARAHGIELSNYTLIGGGGGAQVILEDVGKEMQLTTMLIDHHAVISAIGAALAVTCVSQSKSVAEPTGADIAELVAAVEAKLNAQGAERVSTDFEFDPQRQVLTVTGRGNRPYDQDASVLDKAGLAAKAAGFIGDSAELSWNGGANLLYTAVQSGKRTLFGGATKATLAVALDNSGRSLWCGQLKEHFSAGAGSIEQLLSEIVERRTQYTDGGPALPGLALLTCGRLVPLDMLGSLELVQEALRWEKIPPNASGCFLLR